ncbi:MAG: [Bacilli bacterium]|nr:[citrate (pro-3S)-lyase] ligase [Bacilli bacterium]
EYNKELKRNLPLYGIELIEIPRYRNINGDEISSKTVRRAVEENDDELLEILVPESTLRLIKTRKMK